MSQYGVLFLGQFKAVKWKSKIWRIEYETVCTDPLGPRAVSVVGICRGRHGEKRAKEFAVELNQIARRLREKPRRRFFVKGKVRTLLGKL